MANYLHHIATPFPLNTFAENAVIDAVSAAAPQNRLRNPREGTIADFDAAAEYNDREARLIAIDILAQIDGGLRLMGYAYFDQFFLANRRNAPMYASYITARADHPDSLNAALERAWEIRQREWAEAAAIPGHLQDHDNFDIAPRAIAHASLKRAPSIMRKMKVMIISVVTRLWHDRRL